MKKARPKHKDSKETRIFIARMKNQIFDQDKQIRLLQVFYGMCKDDLAASKKTIGKLKYKLYREKKNNGT